MKALEDAVADEYLSKTNADNIYRKIADSYSKGQTDSLLDARQITPTYRGESLKEA